MPTTVTATRGGYDTKASKQAMRKTATATILTALLLCGCGDSTAEQAQRLLNEAKEDFAMQQYDRVVERIDSLRTAFPKAIKQRKEALRLYQEAELRSTQQELARTDSLLQYTTQQYNAMKAKVDAMRQRIRISHDQLLELNETKARLDSLQACFDVACAKIKYIHKRQQQLDNGR